MLCKGIFWITDIENFAENTILFQIPIDSMGNIDDSVDRTALNSKNRDNYNHKKTWQSINTKETRNKRFDYYPRGRVEVSGGKAIIYITPIICTDEIIDFLIDKFDLTEKNGINKIYANPDYSEHYKCHFDR